MEPITTLMIIALSLGGFIVVTFIASEICKRIRRCGIAEVLRSEETPLTQSKRGSFYDIPLKDD